jgi:Pentapeptide repeats (9 copies)
MLRRLADGPGQSSAAGNGQARARLAARATAGAAVREDGTGGGKSWQAAPRWTLLPRDDVPMKLPHGRQAHEDARPAWRQRLARLWMLAFRRQHHKENTAVLSDPDATERHITEQYTKAVDQLASDKATVRLGGLYTLEGLAQDNPAHRQTIVNVICAYLRMPFSPTAPASKPEPEDAKGQKERGTENETEADGIGCPWQQERKVRLTAQRILGDHLRDDRAKDQRSTDPPSSRFWKNIRLDFTGATLIDFNLVNGVMANANFYRAAFSGNASFGGAGFSGDALFDGAAFSGNASFGGAGFSGDALFDGAAFGGNARFDGAAFSGIAGFRRAAFSGDARFRRAAFSSVAGFGEAAFSGDARFDKATFGGGASFGEATFSGDARFGKAAFTSVAWFRKATFSGDARFGGATFSSDAWFDNATFSRSASFDEATFSGDAWFHNATFSRSASFDEAAFSRDAWFDKATFSGDVWFDEAAFSGDGDALHFEQVRILSHSASHMWPTGWRLADGDGAGYTVVRAKDDGGS